MDQILIKVRKAFVLILTQELFHLFHDQTELTDQYIHL